MMYEQRFIDLVDENYLDNIITNQSSMPVSINDRSMNDQAMYYAFQHYIIKASKDSKRKKQCEKYIGMFYDDFINNPHLFYNSPLLRNTNIDLLLTDPTMNTKIKNFRDTYFDPQYAMKLYNKERTKPLTDKEKNRLYSFFLTRINNPKFENYFNAEIKRMLNSDYKELTDSELAFYGQYASNFSTEMYGMNNNTHVVIGEEVSARGKQRGDGFILIDKSKFNSLDLFTKTVCHETRHAYQFYSSKNKSNREALDIAISHLFSKYLDTKTYNSYHTNYKYSGIELDAEIYGHSNAVVFLNDYERKDLSKNVKENRKKVVDKRRYYPFMKDGNGNNYPIDIFIAEELDKIIAAHPEEIKNYPVLKSLYYSDGKARPFSNIMFSRINHTLENRHVYSNHIFKGIYNGELNSVDLSKSDDEYIMSFGNTLSQIYRDAVFSNLWQYIRDEEVSFNDKKLNENQIIFATNYYLDLANQTLNFIYSNFDLLMFPYMNEEVDNNIPLSNFFYDFRDFTLDKINNPVIKKNQNTINRIMELKRKTDWIIYKFNIAYIQSRIKDYPDEILNYSFNYKDKGKITFKYYCENILPKMLDGHQEMNTKDGKLYVGTFLKGRVKYIENKLNEQHTL